MTVEDKAQSYEIENRFTYHAPQGNQPARYEQVRNEAKAFAMTLCRNCPTSRELTTALTYLDACVMFANASIARE